MIYASGYVEADTPADVEALKQQLSENNITVGDSAEDRIVFLIEREAERDCKSALENLKDIPGVKSVYLSYFSIDGADEEV